MCSILVGFSVQAYITTQIVRKTLLFSQSDRQQDFAWNRQQTEWNSAQLVALSAQSQLAYGSMSLEPTETRPRSNFSDSRVAFSKAQAAKR